MQPAPTDTQSVRVPLTHKFILGSLLVGAAVVLIPWLLDRSGLAVAPWIVPFVALGAGGLLGFILSRDLTTAFHTLNTATKNIQRGDLNTPIGVEENPRFPDETHGLALSIESMVRSLRALVEDVQATSERLTGSAHELTRYAKQVSHHNTDISSTVSELAEGVTEQQKLLQVANRGIHEIASTIELNAARAREAFGFAAEANQKANSGVDVARLAIEKMRLVFERVEQSVTRVFELQEKTRAVSQITGIITSVASSTNLLSLNASIEAARAGEAGRGFAVVADEIRKLSESAAQSTEEISTLVNEIQTETNEVADEMRESSLGVKEGREDIDTMAHSLEHIRSAVSEAALRAEEIFHGADSQTQDLEHMVKSMDNVSQVAGGNADVLSDIAATSRGQVASMAEMVASAKSLSDLAEELRAALRRFDTGGPGDEKASS